MKNIYEIFLNGIQIMDIIIGSSRAGYKLGDLITLIHPHRENVTIIPIKSAKLSVISSRAIEIIKSNPSANIHLYIIGGYCDLTKMETSSVFINGRRRRHEEVVFREEPESAVPRV